MPIERARGSDSGVGRQPERNGQTSAIVYAGGSRKRELFLRDMFPQFNVLVTSGGAERDIDSTITIAREKIDFAIQRNPDVRGLMQNNNTLIIATDVRTNPLTRYSLEGVPRTRSLRKPHGKHDIMKTFRRIARAAETSDPYYWVGAGTVLRRKGHFDYATADHMWAQFDPAVVMNFGTPQGIEEYFQAFKDFYLASGMYGNNPEEQPKPEDVAGGLAFDVLASLGAIKSVNGIDKDDPGFRAEVKRGSYLALIGFNLDILRQIRPDIYEAVDRYSPLEHVTALAMGEIPSS